MKEGDDEELNSVESSKELVALKERVEDLEKVSEEATGKMGEMQRCLEAGEKARMQAMKALVNVVEAINEVVRINGLMIIYAEL